MDCLSCGHSNPEGSRFCNGCGTPLSAADRVAAPEHLAEKVRAGRGVLEGERKQVTVLFADVQGSMELAERTDPEALREIMDGFFAVLSDGVHRFEGTVDKFTGDGIMALFGAPIAHEDHAHRACYAALHLREELTRYSDELRRSEGLNFSVRMGLNSGEVVVGSIGENLSLEYTAIGHTVGLAQRMEQLAAPGSAYLTESTAQLVEGFFELRDLGGFDVKGSSSQVQVFELSGAGAARTRLDVSRSRGFSRFVGREDEMEELERALAKSREGEGQVIGVVGEPGVGKSRLCYELVQRCRARGTPVYEAAALAHARGVPLLPVLQMMRSYFGISGEDSDQSVREKVAGRLLLLDPEMNEELPLVFDFLGVPDPNRLAPGVDPEARKARLIDLVRRLVHVQAERDPGVNLLEDLHWIDPSSDEFLAGLVDAVKGSRTLTVVNFRPEYEADWMAAEHYHQIDLEPLGAEAVTKMLEEQLGSDPSLDGLADLVQDRTQGNPFFVEEVVQELIEAGALSGERGAYRLTGTIEEVSVPATVHSVLAARIDRLPEQQKVTLQAASVLGREFRRPVLTRIAGVSGEDAEGTLVGLIGGEFIHEQQLYPEAVYSFKHPLTQEVAHGTLLGERRRQLHGAAAKAIAELLPERADENSALIASHWEAAEEPLEAARWHARAASWAGYRDPAPTLEHWKRVRELVEQLPETDETALLDMTSRLWTMQFGWRLGISDDEAAELFDVGMEIALRREDTAMQAMFNSIYSTTSAMRGRVLKAVELAREGIRIADESGDAAIRIAMRTGGAYVMFMEGALRDALRETEIGIEIGREDPSLGRGLGVTSPYAFCVMFRGGILSNFGRLEEARTALEEGMEVARREGDLEAEAWNWSNRVHLAWQFGDPEAAVAAGTSGIEAAERVGDVFTRSWSLNWFGMAQGLAENWESAIAALEESMEMTRANGTAMDSEPWRLGWLGDAYTSAGDPERGLSVLDEAVRLGVERGSRAAESNVRWLRGRTLIARHGAQAADEIREELGIAQRMAEEIGYALAPAWNRLELAELARLEEDGDSRHRLLGEAREIFERHAATGWVRRADELLGAVAR